MWWRERDHRTGICVCEDEMGGHVIFIRGQASGEDGETVERESKRGERRQPKNAGWLLQVWASKTSPDTYIRGGSRYMIVQGEVFYVA
jgi:hypothetical protein